MSAKARTVETVDGSLSVSRHRVRIRGRETLVPSVQIAGRTVIVTGGWLKVAAVHDENLVEGETVADPESFLAALRRSGLKADVFTFAQKPPDWNPKYSYRFEWDNLAAIPITTFADWWNHRISAERGVIRNAAKEGMVVRQVNLDDAFVREIIKIQNETPLRQGRPFWHFNKSFETVKAENSTYEERNAFLGAYQQGELVGFVRMIFAGKIAHILQFLVKMKHSGQSPASPMMAEAVKLCEQAGVAYLIYGNYIYRDATSSLTEFKRRRGFEAVLVPRYFIPLTRTGAIAMRLGLHRGISRWIPKWLLRWLLRVRKSWYSLRFRSRKAEG